MTKPKPIVIYHGNCADGFTAAWCFWRKFKDTYDYFAGVYQEPPPDVTDRTVFLVDFSYKRPVVEEMLAKAKAITLIDHHKSSMDDLWPLIEEKIRAGDENRLGWYCDGKRSGARLAWDFLFPHEPPPPLLAHVEDRDLWRFALPNTREIQACLFSYEYDFAQWDRLMASDAAALQGMALEGAAIERKHHKDIAELVRICERRININGFNVAAASLPYTLSSDAGHLMAKGRPFAACYWDTDTARIFSLRSDENGMDVSEIAKTYGGGGHVHAAGFSVPRDHELAKV